MKKLLLMATFFWGMLGMVQISKAQEAVIPRLSPTAIVTMKFENTYVKVTYCQPHKRGRHIFGDLLPYGKIWRTGANEATEITTTGPIIIGETRLEPGTYSIFTVPYEDHWTLILNAQLGQWGAYNYHEKSDVFRIDLPTAETDTEFEPFTISFEQKNQKADMVMAWEKTKVVVPIKFLD